MTILLTLVAASYPRAVQVSSRAVFPGWMTSCERAFKGSSDFFPHSPTGSPKLLVKYAKNSMPSMVLSVPFLMSALSSVTLMMFFPTDGVIVILASTACFAASSISFCSRAKRSCSASAWRAACCSDAT